MGTKPFYQRIEEIPDGVVFDTQLSTTGARPPALASDTGDSTVMAMKIETNENNQFTTQKADKTGIYTTKSGESRYFVSGTPLPKGYAYSHERGADVAAESESTEVETDESRAKSKQGAPENRSK